MSIFDHNINFTKLKDIATIEVGGLITLVLIACLKKLFGIIKTSLPILYKWLFNGRAKITAKIHVILRKILYKLEGDRASLFVFTNGEVKPENEQLLITCFTSVLEDGINNPIDDRRKINVKSLGDNFLNNLLKNETLVIDENTESTLLSFFIIQNTKQAFLRTFNNKNNKIYGFICLEFCNDNILDHIKIKKELELARLKLCRIIN